MNARATALLHKRAASSLVAARGGVLQRKCACGGSPGFDGECAECRGKRLGLQRRSTGEAESTAVPPIVHDILRSPGQPLDPATRAFMEPRFGHDFSRVRVHSTMPPLTKTGLIVSQPGDQYEQQADHLAEHLMETAKPNISYPIDSQVRYDFSRVRVHTDARAAESARAVNALAYTLGTDVVFGAGLFAPESSAGRKLLAHELAHVVQQTGSSLELRSTPWFTPSPPSVPILARQGASGTDEPVVVLQGITTGGKGLTGYALGFHKDGLYFVNGVEIQFNLGPGARRYTNIKPRNYAGPEKVWIKHGNPQTETWTQLPTGGNRPDDPFDEFVTIQRDVVAYYDSPGPGWDFLKTRPSRLYIVQLFTGWIEGVPLTGGAAEQLSDVVPWHSVIDLVDKNWEDKAKQGEWTRQEEATTAGWGWKPTTPPGP